VKTHIVPKIALCIAIAAIQATGFAQGIRPENTSALERVWNFNTPSKLSQSVRIDGGVVSKEKFGLHWETRIAPATPALSVGFSTTTTDSMGVIHRVMLDRTGRTYFGYDVRVDVLVEASTYRITFQPLAMTLEIAKGLDMVAWSSDDRSAWIPLAPPRFPSPQNIRSGEILELTLLTNSATKQNIVDYLSVQEPLRKTSPFQRPPEERDFTYATGIPRDLTPNDVELRIRAPRLSINGQLDLTSTTHFEEVSGTFVWIYTRKHGRFVFSLAPHNGFSKSGEVRGSTLTFKDGADTYSLSAGAPIAPGQAAFNLYVLHEPDWKPTYPFADLSAFNMGAEFRIETIPVK